MAAPRIIKAGRLGLGFANLSCELAPEFFVTRHYSAGARAKNAREGVALVRSFHAAHKANGWGGNGYHYVIPDDGALTCARPTLLKGTHTALHNSNNNRGEHADTTGDRPTPAQRDTYRWLLDNAHTAAMPKPHRADQNLREGQTARAQPVDRQCHAVPR